MGVLGKAERGAAMELDVARGVVRASSSLAPEHNVDHTIGAAIGACIH